MQTFQELYEQGILINVTDKYINSNSTNYEVRTRIDELKMINNTNRQVLCKYQDNTYALNPYKYGVFYNLKTKLYYMAPYIEEKTERLYLFDIKTIIQYLEPENTSFINIDYKRAFYTITPPQYQKEHINIFDLDFTKLDEKIFIKKDYIPIAITDTIPNPFN